MKNAVIKSLYESFNKPLNESNESTSDKKLFKEYKIVVDGHVFEISHTPQRRDEILEILKKDFPNSKIEVQPYNHYESGSARKQLERIIDKQLQEYGVNESLDEAIKTVDRYKLTDRFWKYFDASVKGMRLIDNLSVLTGKSRDDILSLNTKDAWEKFPKDGFLGYFSTDDIKKAVYEYEGRIPHSSLKRSSDEVLKEDYNSDLEIERKIQKYLDDNDLWCDVSVHDGVVSVEINWGDWKHDHAYCKELMSDLGYVLVGKEITEEDGSDTFSAIHTYEKLNYIDESMNDKQFPEFKDWLEQEYYPGFAPTDLSDEEYYELEDLYYAEKEKFEEK